MFGKDSIFQDYKKALSKLTKMQCVHFSVHVAKSVLHVWEEQFPDDLRPRLAIKMAEQWSVDKNTFVFFLTSAAAVANDADTSASFAAGFARAAASAAAWVARVASSLDSSYCAAYVISATVNCVNQKWEKLEWISKLYSSIYKEQPFPESWKTRDAVSIAKDMLTSRNLNDMPILADALEDSGCQDYEVLNHLRNDKDLWTPVDWVLMNLEK